MPAAELIAIGTELLLGEIQDTNTRYLARTLRDFGVDIYRATMVGDNSSRIAQAIREALQRSQIILTTGGLGPTVDDPTRAAVALALDIETEYRPELWEQIQARFQRYGRAPSENNRRQAWIPSGAIPIENPVGTAPAFICETINACIISLPGVPREMEYLLEHAVLPYLRERFQLTGTIKAKVLHIAGVGESQIDEWIGDLETSANPTVGLLAHPGQVDIRITAKAESQEAADQMIADMETQVRQRVPEGLYGVDQQTLEEAIQQEIHQRGWDLAVVECGLGGAMRNLLEPVHPASENIQVVVETCQPSELRQALADLCARQNSAAGLGISLAMGEEKHTLYLAILTPQGILEWTRTYGGERALSPLWAMNTALETLRRTLVEPTNPQ